MKRISVLVALVVAALAMVAFSSQREAVATPSVTELPAEMTLAPAEPVLMSIDMSENGDKKCGFDSDCPHGKCKSGKCGGCGFTSDCKGWGKCDSGWCGACSFDSECKGFGKCSSGKCTESPY